MGYDDGGLPESSEQPVIDLAEETSHHADRLGRGCSGVASSWEKENSREFLGGYGWFKNKEAGELERQVM